MAKDVLFKTMTFGASTKKMSLNIFVLSRLSLQIHRESSRRPKRMLRRLQSEQESLKLFFRSSRLVPRNILR